MRTDKAALWAIVLWCYGAISWAENTPPTTLNFCAIDIANPPFYLFATSDPMSADFSKGVAFTLMQELESTLQKKIVMHRRPWKRCLQLVKQGDLDAVLGASYLKEREAFGRYPKTANDELDRSRLLYSSHYWLYSNNPEVSWDGVNLNIPKGTEIGAGLGFSSVKILEKLNVQVYEEYHPKNLIKLLNNRRLSAVAGYANQMEREIEHFNATQSIKRLTPPLKKDDMFLMFSINFYEENRALVESIWTKLGNIHHSGRYDQLEKQVFHTTALRNKNP